MVGREGTEGEEWQVEKSHRIHVVRPESKIREHSKSRCWVGKAHRDTIWKVDLTFSCEIMPN